jgi:hypothetical protein
MRNAGSAPSQPVGGGSSTVAVTGSVQLFNAGSGSNGSVALNDAIGSLQARALFGATIVGTAAAGNKAIAELNNPAASGKVVYVYWLDMFVPVAMAINLLIDGTTITPATAGINLAAGGAAGVAKTGGSNQLAPTGTLIYTSPALAVNSQFQLPQPWQLLLPAGHNLQLQGQTVNQAFTCNVRWLELNA